MQANTTKAQPMKSLPVRLLGIHKSIYGGAFRQAPKNDFFLVKMAVELNLPHHLSIPTEDFNVPDKEDMRKGLKRSLEVLFSDTPIYVGCMGGIGRTGLYLALMAKVLHLSADPVAYVREHYYAHAVETQHQQKYIADFNVRQLSMYAYILAAKYQLRSLLVRLAKV